MGRGAAPLAVPGAKALQFVCASPADGSGGFTSPSLNVIYACPIRVYDALPAGTGGYPFGGIALTVEAGRPDHAAFSSLHGSPVEDGATPQAREGLTHTTFSTTDDGIGWTDSFTGSDYPGAGLQGIYASNSMDAQGRVAIAYTWRQSGAGTAMIRVFKGDTTDNPDYQVLYEDEPYTIPFKGAAKPFEPRITYLAVPGAPRPEPSVGPVGPGSNPSANQTVNETVGATPPPTPTAAPRSDGFDPTGYYAVTWIARTPTKDASAPAATPGPSATGSAEPYTFPWLDARWSAAGAGNNASDWHALDKTQRVDGCSDASNPVGYDGRLYVACVVDAGYHYRRRASRGDVDLWSLDPVAGTMRLEAWTHVTGSHPKLAVAPDGAFAIAASSVRGVQTVAVHVAYGNGPRTWNVPLVPDVGPTLHRALGNYPVRDAAVTALGMTEDDHTAWVVYKEWNDLSEAGAVPAPPAPPTGPPSTDEPLPRLSDYKKALVTMDLCNTPIAGAEFNLGTSPEVYQQQALAANAAAFNDLQDGLQVVRMPDGQERVFLAVNDYGSAQYASVVAPTGAADTPCPWPPPPPIPPVAAIPQALSLSNPAGAVVGAAVGVVAVAMIAYLLAVKRKVADTLAAEDR